jgi:hypothetical protein
MSNSGTSGPVHLSLAVVVSCTCCRMRAGCVANLPELLPPLSPSKPRFVKARFCSGWWTQDRPAEVPSCLSHLEHSTTRRGLP